MHAGPYFFPLRSTQVESGERGYWQALQSIIVLCQHIKNKVHKNFPLQLTSH